MSSPKNFVFAQRDRFSHPLFEREKFCRGYAWDWIVANAVYSDEGKDLNIKGEIVHIKRGQLSYSIRYLSKAWNWSSGSVSRFIRRLEAEAMIETESETGQLIITVCNYSKYQSSVSKGETEAVTQRETVAEQRRNSGDTNNKKENKDKKDNTIPANAGDDYAYFGKMIRLTERDYSAWKKEFPDIDDFDAELDKADEYYVKTGEKKWFFAARGWLGKENRKALESKDHPKFDEWWETYPVKEDRQAASRAFKQAMKNSEFDEIMWQTKKYLRLDGDFVKKPANFFNDGTYDNPKYKRAPYEKNLRDGECLSAGKICELVGGHAINRYYEINGVTCYLDKNRDFRENVTDKFIAKGDGR